MRRFPRIPVKLDAVLISEGVTLKETITNIGPQGAFVTVPSHTEVGYLVNLRFRPPSTPQPLELLAQITRQTPDGVGLEFLDLDAENRRQLWSALIPLLPQNLKECPYCAEVLSSPPGQNCGVCLMPLDFRQRGYLERLPEDAYTPRMIGACQTMLQVFRLIDKVSPTDFPVLVTGASGTGKEMVAQAIRQRSRRARGPFVVVNCGAIPRELLESELFGHERGAFSGAYHTVVGKVELAHQGTLFLDEIGELPPELQVKLLRFLQGFTFERVGGRKTIQVDVRIISATNADLKKLVKAERFREDLYYRLEGINIELPLLKDRVEDIPILAELFLRRLRAETGKELDGFSKDAREALLGYSWPGNIRELMNRLQRAVVMADGRMITANHLGLSRKCPPINSFDGWGLREAVSHFEATLLSETLIKCGGCISRTAEMLKTSRSVIYHLLNKHNLASRPDSGT
jgi:DNA-binding NtrC family response regulator